MPSVAAMAFQVTPASLIALILVLRASTDFIYRRFAVVIFIVLTVVTTAINLWCPARLLVLESNCPVVSLKFISVITYQARNI